VLLPFTPLLAAAQTSLSGKLKANYVYTHFNEMGGFGLASRPSSFTLSIGRAFKPRSPRLKHLSHVTKLTTTIHFFRRDTDATTPVDIVSLRADRHDGAVEQCARLASETEVSCA
jgi:hypothetical protein